MVAVRKDRKMPSRMGLNIIMVWGFTNMPRLTALGKRCNAENATRNSALPV